MNDPEGEYARLVTGSPGSARDAAEVLRSARRKVDDARADVDAAARVPEWSGGAAAAFAARLGQLSQGAALHAAVIVRAYGALDTAAAAYDAMQDAADEAISHWRKRPGDMSPVIEQLLAAVVTGALLRIGRDYDTQLHAVAAVLDGEEVDLDGLDAETRAWVAHGLDRNDDWTRGNGSGLGPLIPNTAAGGDTRGLTPQGLGYDAATRSLLQAYYGPDHDSVLSVIDEVSGKEVTEVELGGYGAASDAAPEHAGGVAVDGDRVYVTDKGTVYTYSLKEIRDSTPGEPVPQSARPQSLDGGSYATVHEGRLYLGDHDANEMHVYTRGPTGWVKEETVQTPELVQGVAVRDGEYVFSTSYGRDNASSLVVQDRASGERGEPYPLPNMSQGVVEVDGRLIASYESAAGKFSEPTSEFRWPWEDSGMADLWANPFMTSTPLSELGLTDDVEVDPSSLDRAARDLDSPADALGSAASSLQGVQVPATALGTVPAAGKVVSSVNTLVDEATAGLRTGARAVRRAGEELQGAGNAYRAADDGVRQRFGARHP